MCSKFVLFRNKLHFFEEFLNGWMEKFRGDNSTSAVSLRLHQDITSYLVSIFKEICVKTKCKSFKVQYNCKSKIFKYRPSSLLLLKDFRICIYQFYCVCNYDEVNCN